MNTNTTSARYIRAQIALVALIGSLALWAYILLDLVTYGNDLSYYFDKGAFLQAVGAFALAVILFGWNAVTYSRPRYARRSR